MGRFTDHPYSGISFIHLSMMLKNFIGARMKMLLPVIFILTFLPQTAYTQWNYSHHFNEDDFNAIDFVTPEIGFLGGEHLIARTTDGGKEWLTLSDIYGYTVNALSFLSQNTGVAVGEYYIYGPGFISYTTNGGVNWEIVSDMIGTMNDVFLLDTYHAWAVGDGGIYKADSNQGLEDWNFVYASQTALQTVYFLNQSTGWAAGWGEMLKTTDGGNTWAEQETGIASRFLDIFFLNENKGWALAYYDKLLTTTNGGTTWTIDTLTTTIMNKVHFYNDNEGILTGNGKMMSTTDGGTSWTEHNITPGTWFDGISIVGDSTICLAGLWSTMTKSTDRGNSWTQMGLDEFNDLYSISMLSADVGLAVGAEGTIIRKSGGRWLSGIKSTTHNLNSVHALGVSAAVAVGDSGTIIKSFNAYRSWTHLASPTVSDLYCLQFAEGRGWIAGDNGTILRSNNYGEIWDVSATGVSERLTSVSFVDNLTGWAAGDNGVIIKTTDGGDSWLTQNSGTSLNILKIQFMNSSTGFALAGGTHFFRTDDGGTTWNLIYSDAENNYNTTDDFSFYSTTRGWMCGGWGNIFRTTDGGYNWRHQYNSSSVGFHNVDVIDSNKVFLAANNGLILYTTVGGGDPTPVPVELISFTAAVQKNNVTLNWSTASETNNRGFEIQRKSENDNWITIGFREGKGTAADRQEYSFTDRNVLQGSYLYRLKQMDFNGSSTATNAVDVEVGPPEYSLSQNYPNPFNPTTTIDYQVAEPGFVTLKIYNILGEEAAVLVNELKKAGTYTIIFNGSSLAGGVYIYRLTGGSFSASRKFVLIK